MLSRALHAALDFWRIRRDPVGWARSLGVNVGKDCRLIDLNRGTFGTEPYLVTLGDHVTLAARVQFITHDGGVWVFRREHPDVDVLGPVRIGNNVFVGYGTTFMPRASVGDNCVIGAGSVVTRAIPAGHVAVGVPCRPIKTIDAYWQTIQPRALQLRGLPDEEKRRRIEAAVATTSP